MDDLRIERERLSAALDRLERLSPGGTLGSPAIVCQVYNAGSIASTVPAYFATHPIEVTGAPVEGSGGTLTIDSTRTVMVEVIGPKVPVVGDKLIAYLIGGRWVARKAVPAGSFVINFDSCPCALVPTTLYLHVAHQDPEPGTGSFHDATLVYGPPPTEYISPTWVATSNYFFSLETFHDPNLGPWRYVFVCGSGLIVYSLAVLFSNFNGTGLITAGMALNWRIGFPGNFCTPFTLGAAFGSDPISRQNIAFYIPQVTTVP